jgi:hypothetical protein
VTSSPAGLRIIAWAGAAVFAGSLVFFLFSYLVTFGVVTTGPLRPVDIVIDVALFSVFAVHHSVFARERFRSWVARVVPAGLERSLYVWIASVMLIAVCAWWRELPGLVWRIEGAAAWLAAVPQLAGAWLTLRSAAAIDIWELAGVKQVRNPKTQVPNPKYQSGSQAPGPESPFRTDGAYGWVRHPIYLGWFLLVFGVGTMTMTRMAFALISCVYIVIAIPFEERSLRRTAGEAYETYRRQVPWKLIPYVY